MKMDNNWINNRTSSEYVEGLKLFLDFALVNTLDHSVIIDPKVAGHVDTTRSLHDFLRNEDISPDCVIGDTKFHSDDAMVEEEHHKHAANVRIRELGDEVF